jgi:hypothetical protein
MAGLVPRLSGLSKMVVMKGADSSWTQRGVALTHYFVAAGSWQANGQTVGNRARLQFGLRFEYFKLRFEYSRWKLDAAKRFFLWKFRLENLNRTAVAQGRA